MCIRDSFHIHSAAANQMHHGRQQWWAMYEDRAFDGIPASARRELGDGRSALNRHVGIECRQQSAWQQDGTAAITLGQRRWKLDPALALCARIPNGNLGGEQEGSFFEPQSGRDQQVREKRVARTIAVACSGALGSLDGQATQSDVPKGLVVGQIDKADIGPAGSALVGVVATGNGSAPAPG